MTIVNNLQNEVKENADRIDLRREQAEKIVIELEDKTTVNAKAVAEILKPEIELIIKTITESNTESQIESSISEHIKIDFQEYVTPIALENTHTFSFGFPVEHAWVELKDNISNAMEVAVVNQNSNNVTVRAKMQGGGPGGAGIIRYRIWAVSF